MLKVPATSATRLMFAGVLLTLLQACGGGGGSSGGGDGGAGVPPPPPPPPPPTMPTTTTSSQTAYATPTATGWQVVPLLTVGDTPSGSGYAMVGKPDGLGMIAGRYGSTGELVDTGTHATVFMNHELPGNRGDVRAHGTRGAFVSQWTLELATLRATEGRDFVTRLFRFDGTGWSNATGTLSFDRLCAADLPPRSAFFNVQTGAGYDGQLFVNGEEIAEGRGFVNVLGGAQHGEAYEVPYLGKYSHENLVAHPNSGDTTLAISTDDDNPGQVYVYVGTKRTSGNPVERAGLHGGKLYGVRVVDGGTNYGGGVVARENKGAINGRFDLVDVTDAALGTGANLQAVSIARGVTDFARPEDGAWDVRDAATFYVAITGAVIDGARQSPRLYRMVFDSVTAPTGGRIELVVDGDNIVGTDGTAGRGFDNVAVDAAGRVLVMEDGGSTDNHVSKVWMIDATNGQATQILEADRNRVLPGGTAFLTHVEEHSGVVEVTDQLRSAAWFDAARRYYLGTLQTHYPLSETLFEGGQLYLFVSP
jgi:hypothetical protein